MCDTSCDLGCQNVYVFMHLPLPQAFSILTYHQSSTQCLTYHQCNAIPPCVPYRQKSRGGTMRSRAAMCFVRWQLLTRATSHPSSCSSTARPTSTAVRPHLWLVQRDRRGCCCDDEERESTCVYVYFHCVLGNSVQ